MRDIHLMNSKEKKNFLKLIEERFDCDIKDLKDSVLIRAGHRIYLTNRELEKINTADLRIDNIGLYIATIEEKLNKESRIRLSIEGSQIIGPKAKKNILKINKKQLKEWFFGNDFEVNKDDCERGFVILKYKDDFVGCGNLTKKEEGYEIKNYVPKERRLKHFLE
jgi:NOL1/NOP2/fmu family ribosome biogenesis protein